jgi:hypothetical protein
MAIYQGMAQDLVVNGQVILSLLVLITGGLLAFFLSVYLFSWDSDNAARRTRTVLATLVSLPFIVGMVMLQ